MANNYEDQYNQTTPQGKRPKKPPKRPSRPAGQGHGAGTANGPPTVHHPAANTPSHNPSGPGTGSTNAAEVAHGIPSAPAGGGYNDPFNGWDANSLIDETLGESGWYGSGGGSGGGGGRRSGGGGGGGGGGGVDNSAAIGQLAGADAQTAALQAYLESLRGTQGLREEPFNTAKANLAAMYGAAKGTIGQAQTDVQGRLGANSAASQQALANYAAGSQQMNQQAQGSGRAELDRLLADLRAQGMSTTALEAQANVQNNGAEQMFMRDQQRNAALGQANTDSFNSRDSTAALVNASALGGLEANNLQIGGQIGTAQAQAMLQFQQELAQAQLQVAQQQAAADAIRAQYGLPAATPAAPAAAAPAAAPAPAAAAPAAPQPAAPQVPALQGDVTRPGGEPIVDPALVERYVAQMQGGGRSFLQYQRRPTGPRAPATPRGR